jgi:hypothetical protein
MESFATNGQSRSERRPTRRLRRVLGLAAAASAMSAVLANPALGASPSVVENTVAAAAGVANNVVQSTPAANPAPPAPPAPPAAAEPAPAAPDPAPPEATPAAGGASETSGGGANTAEKTIGGAAETANDALSGLAGKTATDLTDTVDKATGGLLRGAAPEPPTGGSRGDESRTSSPGPSGSGSALVLPGLPKATIVPLLPANPILSGDGLLPALGETLGSLPTSGLDLGGILGPGGPVAGLLPALGETLRSLPTSGLDLGGILGPGGPVAGLLPALGQTLGETLGSLPTSGLGGILGAGGQLIAPIFGSGTIPPAPPAVPSGLSGEQSGSPIDQPSGSPVLTVAPDLPVAPGEGLTRNTVLSPDPWDSLITDSTSSTSSPSVESAAPAGGSPDHRPLPGPGSPSGAVSSAPTGLLLFGFAAMLLAALAAAAPAIRRLIQIAPACWRPAPFVALLERPG